MEGFMLLYTIIRRLYQFISENFRFCFNYLFDDIDESFLLLFGQWDKIRMAELLPSAVEVCLFFIILWAYVTVIKDFVDKYYWEKKKNLVFSLFDEEETMNKVEMMALPCWGQGQKAKEGQLS